jgi:TPP-dependent pyruvate/acetoin dehydrogenase alpha subunit
VYSSSILGNALCVAAGVGLGLRVKESAGIVFVVTGDGALEEGAFAESLTFMRTYEVSGLIVVENNGWSMSTTIAQRRCDIHLEKLSEAFGAGYQRLEGNDPVAYAALVQDMRDDVARRRRPAILEVELNTLGDWRADPDGRYINYHAGPAPTVELSPWPLLRENREDPVFALLDHLGSSALQRISGEQLALLQSEIA